MIFIRRSFSFQHTVKMLMSRLWSVVTFGRCVWARKSRDIQLATFRRHTPATCGCWDRGRLFSLYRILCWCPGYFVSLAMGCVVVTEPFDLTTLVEDTCSPFQIGCKPILAASASQHGWAHYSLVVAKGMLVGTMHGFADTVRFRGRGLIVDRAITTGHNRMIRGGAVFLNLIFAFQFAHEMRTLQVRQRTCVQQNHSTHAPDNITSWLLPRGVQCVDWVGRSFFVFECSLSPLFRAGGRTTSTVHKCSVPGTDQQK